MQQINKVILDEGLAYVLDNEAARSIQEHMWAEQIAREQMEATYGVELQGAALKFLEGIRERQSKQKNPFPEYYKEKAQEFKMPKSKVGTQKHRKMEIIVNNETYDNYDDAYDAVLKKLENLQKRCDKLNGKS